MKKLATKLMISVLSVALAFIALGTSTFAWFSMNTTVEATGMQLTAVTPINLLINDAEDVATPANWKNSVAANESFGTGKLFPASSADGKTRFNAIINTGNYIGAGAGGIAEDDTTFQLSSDQTPGVGETKPTELALDTDGYWATYTFALKLSQRQDTAADVYLSTLNFYEEVTVTAGTVTSAAGYFKYNDSTKEFTAAELDADLLPEGNPDGEMDHLTAGTYYRLGGIANACRAALYTGATKGALTTFVQLYANNDEDSTKPVSTAITTYGTKYETIKASNNTVVEAVAANDSDTFEVNDTPVYVTLVVWIEGQDTDCVNANAGHNFKIELGFQVVTA